MPEQAEAIATRFLPAPSSSLLASAMSIGSPKLARREQAIEATRRRLAPAGNRGASHQGRACPARSRLRRRRRRLAEPQASPAHAATPNRRSRPIASDGAERARPLFDSIRTSVAGVSDPGLSPSDPSARNAQQHASSAIVARCGTSARLPSRCPTRRRGQSLDATGDRAPQSAASYRKAASPLLCSFAVHAVVLVALRDVHGRHDRSARSCRCSPAPPISTKSSPRNSARSKSSRRSFEDAELQNVVVENPGIQHCRQFAARV